MQVNADLNLYEAITTCFALLCGTAIIITIIIKAKR